MRRTLAFFFVFAAVISIFSITVSASSPKDQVISTSTEYLDNGDYVVTTVYQCDVQPRTGKTGYKTSTYYNSSGSKIFDVTVKGTFSYTYGSSASATNASTTVNIYNSSASFVSKDAYTSNNSAVGNGKVRYNGNTASRTVILKCDVYGNLY